MKFRQILFAAVALALVSCQSKDEPAVEVSVIKAEATILKVGPEGGRKTISYSSVGKAYGMVADVQTDADWVTVSDVTPAYVELSIGENSTGSDRNAKIVLSGYDAKAVSVHIIQSKVSDSQPAYGNFSITVSKISSSSACIEVDPLNPSAYYYTDLFPASLYDAYGEKKLISSMMENVVNMAIFAGVDDPRLLLYKGYFNTDYDEAVNLDLRDNTEYYVAAVDMDVDKNGNLTTSGKGVFQKFRTLKPSQVAMTFSFDIRGTQVEVTPSADYTYVCGVASQKQWDAYKDPSDAARDYIDIAKRYSMLETIVYSGKRLVDFTYLLDEPGDYVVYAVGYRNSTADKGLTTDIQFETFRYPAK